jgi:hypothetical protein
MLIFVLFYITLKPQSLPRLSQQSLDKSELDKGISQFSLFSDTVSENR